MLQRLDYSCLLRAKKYIGSTQNIENILSSILGMEMYNAHEVSKRLNLKMTELKDILRPVRIELIDDLYLTNEGIEYLASRELGKVKRYFELSIANYSLLSDKERRVFNAFIKRYRRLGKKVLKWDDLKVEVIRRDCRNEILGKAPIIFHEGAYISYEELTSPNPIKEKSLFQQIRSTLMYNVKNLREWIGFNLIQDSTIIFILTHHFHIFTSDDNNISIHPTDGHPMFNPSQNAERCILAG